MFCFILNSPFCCSSAAICQLMLVTLFTDLCFHPYFISEEKKMVATSQERLLELLSPKCLNGESEANSWQQSYVQFLQQQGIDVDMQKKAHLLQLWTTQVGAFCIFLDVMHIYKIINTLTNTPVFDLTVIPFH